MESPWDSPEPAVNDINGDIMSSSLKAAQKLLDPDKDRQWKKYEELDKALGYFNYGKQKKPKRTTHMAKWYRVYEDDTKLIVSASMSKNGILPKYIIEIRSHIEAMLEDKKEVFKAQRKELGYDD